MFSFRLKFKWWCLSMKPCKSSIIFSSWFETFHLEKFWPADTRKFWTTMSPADHRGVGQNWEGVLNTFLVNFMALLCSFKRLHRFLDLSKWQISVFMGFGVQSHCQSVSTPDSSGCSLLLLLFFKHCCRGFVYVCYFKVNK